MLKSTARYFILYILPVTIGIFLGLWLNEWSQSQGEKEKALDGLKTLRAEIASNKVKVDTAANYHAMMIDLIKNNPGQAVIQIRPARVQNDAWTVAQGALLPKVLTYGELLSLSEIYQMQAALNEVSGNAGQMISFLSVISGLLADIYPPVQDKKAVYWKIGFIGLYEDMFYFETELSKRYDRILILLETKLGEGG